MSTSNNRGPVRARVVTVGVGLEEVPPEEYTPERVDRFCVSCTVYFGDNEDVGTEYHTLCVCSPSWLNDHVPHGAVLRGQGLLIMRTYDAARLRKALENYASHCVAADRPALYRKLERLGFSEFEDYNEPPLPQFFIDPEHSTESLPTRD